MTLIAKKSSAVSCSVWCPSSPVFLFVYLVRYDMTRLVCAISFVSVLLGLAFCPVRYLVGFLD